MKRNLIFICILLFSLSAFAFERPAQHLEANFSCSANRGTERNDIFYTVEYGVDGKKYDGIVGIQFYEKVFDVAVLSDFYPDFSTWQFNRDSLSISLGLGGIYHFQNYFSVSCEHDFYGDLLFKLKTDGNFFLTVRHGYGMKAAKVYEIQDKRSWVWDRSLSIGMKVEKFFPNGIELYSEGSSHSLYRYPLFISPKYTFGSAYNLDCGLRFGTEFEINFADQFTTAPYVEAIILKLSVRYTF